MPLVTIVTGDCPKCGAKSAFGNVDVAGTYLSRGCSKCNYRFGLPLPVGKKAVLYLDQPFFSHAFRGSDQRFNDAAGKIRRLAHNQLLVAPFSTVHEEETHQWERRAELFEFIKASARGHEFEPDYDVERTQLFKSFGAWRKSAPAAYQIARDEALPHDIDEWDGYFRIDVGRYTGDIDLVRSLKTQAVGQLIGDMAEWRKHPCSFEADLKNEFDAAAQNYLTAYATMAQRIADGDHLAMMDSPVMATAVPALISAFPRVMPPEQALKECIRFLRSEHFRQTPIHQLTARISATLKQQVRAGAYANEDKATKALSGFFHDTKHIATYAPYSDAIFIDRAMHDLVSKPTVGLTATYGTKVFSLTNWSEFMAWLNGLEVGMTSEHKAALAEVYPSRSAT